MKKDDNDKITTKIIYVEFKDYKKQIECGKLIQGGKMRIVGFACGKLMYYEF